MSNSEEDDAPPAERSRSVMDYDGQVNLRNAMTCGKSEDEYAADVMGGPAAGFDWITDNLDMGHSCAQNLEEEMLRLLTLKSYLILDAEREQRFERITALAARIFDVPIALVSLVDLGRQWFMSNRGLGGRETPRSLAFCAHAIMSTQDLLVVPNATLDPRFMNNALVTSDPHIRFYAGAPLICPEGYKLGTLCVIDRKPRPNGLNLMEKQNLRELAAMVMDAMVSRKEELERVSEYQSRTIACAAHDLLTPLTSIELNLSLLLEDEQLCSVMDEHQRDLIQSSVGSSELLGRICIQAIEGFRGDILQTDRKRKARLPQAAKSVDAQMGQTEVLSKESNADVAIDNEDVEEEGAVNIGRLIETLGQVIEPYPKNVPLTMEVDEDVPPVIISDDLKIFRSALNYLTNACRHTTEGSVHLRLYVKRYDQPNTDHIVFECEDTGPGIEVEKYPSLFVPFCDDESKTKQLQFVAANRDFGVDHTQMNNSGLGLYSVASSISSLDGEFGFRPREDPGSDGSTGSIFWFSVPLVLPSSVREADEMSFEGDQTPHSSIFGSPTHDLDAVSCTEAMLSEASLRDTNEERIQCVMEDDEESRTAKRRTLSVPSEEENARVLDQTVVSVNGSGNEGNKQATRTRCALVVDDSLTIRKGIDKAFTRLGFEVSQAENGLQGLQMLKAKLFDVVLVDFLMPVLDGLDLVQQYRSWESSNRPWFHQHIIGISAHATSNDAATGMRLGMDKYIAKPIPLNTLKEISASVEVQESSKLLDQKFQQAIVSKESTVSGILINPEQVQKSLFDPSPPPDEITPKLSPVCLIAENSPDTLKGLLQCTESLGWRASVVTDGEDALRLLKMRIWDAVFINDVIYPLTGTSCVTRFREWETSNRTTRQNNIFFLSENYDPLTNTMLPLGFDGAMAKPINAQLFLEVLKKISQEENSTEGKVVGR